MECTQCGTELKEKANFCTKCGKDVSETYSLAEVKKEESNILRRIPKKTWRIIIILGGLLLSFYGILLGLTGFWVWRNIDKVFAKKLLRISFIIWIIWMLITLASLAVMFYSRYRTS